MILRIFSAIVGELSFAFRAYNKLDGSPSLVHGVTQLADRNIVITYVKEISSSARLIVKQMR